jgi:hypothetical protein
MGREVTGREFKIISGSGAGFPGPIQEINLAALNN